MKFSYLARVTHPISQQLLRQCASTHEDGELPSYPPPVPTSCYSFQWLHFFFAYWVCSADIPFWSV